MSVSSQALAMTTRPARRASGDITDSKVLNRRSARQETRVRRRAGRETGLSVLSYDPSAGTGAWAPSTTANARGSVGPSSRITVGPLAAGVSRQDAHQAGCGSWRRTIERRTVAGRVDHCRERAGRPVPGTGRRRQRGMGFDFSIVPVSGGLRLFLCLRPELRRSAPPPLGPRLHLHVPGAYGYLLQTMDLDLDTLVWGRIAFGLLSAVGLGIAVAAYLESVADLSPVARLASMVAITYTFSIQDPEYRLLILFLVVFLRSLLVDDVAGLGAFALAAGLAGFYLLVRFSLGFTSLATLLVGCWLVRRPTVAVARLAATTLVAAGSFLGGWILAERGLHGVGSYISTGLGDASGLLVGHEPFH